MLVGAQGGEEGAGGALVFSLVFSLLDAGLYLFPRVPPRAPTSRDEQ